MSDDLDISEFTAAGRVLQERDDYKRQRDAAIKAHEALLKKCDLLTALDGVTAKPPKWLRKSGRSKAHTGIANLLLSDLHLDEVVSPAQMGGVNAYNRDIALLRLIFGM